MRFIRFILQRFSGENGYDNSHIEDARRSIRKAEQVTHVQQQLTQMAVEGKDREYMRTATGAFPADIVADRYPRNRYVR